MAFEMAPTSDKAPAPAPAFPGDVSHYQAGQLDADSPKLIETTDAPSQPDFSKYILPDSTLFKPIPDGTLPDSLLGPSTIELPNPYDQSTHPIATSDQFTASPVPVPADYLPSKDDLHYFRFAARFAAASFSRDGLATMALNEKVPDGGRQLADYLFNNFDAIKSFTSAGDEDHVHLDDIRLVIDLAEAKRQLQTVADSKELILKSFVGLDINEDRVLSANEIDKAKEQTTEPADKATLEALSYTNNFFKDGISQTELAQFNYESLFADLAQKKHHEADMANRVFWPGVAGAAVGAGVGYLTKAKWYQYGFLMIGGEEIGKSAAGLFVADDVEAHYENTAKGAIEQVF